MATLTKGKTFTNGEVVTPQKLHELVDLGTVSGIVNADISASAAIALSKLATGALPTGITVASANIVDGTIVNADISNTAAIADSKLATISTAGKVSNSATTAASTNIANAIVTRDSLGSFSANTITAALAGNAATATKLATARTISLTGAVTGSTTFDGSGNASIATTHTADPVITLTGDVTGSGTMTNLGNVSITATVADDSHNHIIANIDGLQTALDGKQAAGSYAASSHTHGNITNAGAIGTTSGVPIITGTSGKLQAGSFGTTAGTFCQGNDSRLSNARTPTAHTHSAADITSGTLANARTTATNLKLADYVKANPLNAGGYAGQLMGKIAVHDSTTATIDAFGLNTFGVTSYSPGANSGVYSVKAVSKPGANLVQTYIGGILSNNTNTGVIYGTASDYRLKTNIEPLTGALARLAALPVRRFHWLGHTDSPKVDGFLAHEAQAIVPEAVTGTKDAVDAEGNPIHQGIDQSKLVPLLVAAVQELTARVESLEAVTA